VVVMSGPPSGTATPPAVQTPPPVPTVGAPPPPQSVVSKPAAAPCVDASKALFVFVLKADGFPSEIRWQLTQEAAVVQTGTGTGTGTGEAQTVLVPSSTTIASVDFGELIEPDGEWAWRRCLGTYCAFPKSRLPVCPYSYQKGLLPLPIQD
jgi:hypothetical protein